MRSFPIPAPSTAHLARTSRLAACAAAWCGVHCAITPFLVLAAPALALSESAERMLWVATVLLGAMILALGPARRKAGVLLGFAAGSSLWAASLAGWLAPAPEPATSATGSLMVAGALLLSARVCQAGACDTCATEDPSGRDA